jgi:hypothetical protein
VRYISTFESHGTVISSYIAMSHRLKLSLLVLTFNIIGFAEGYLLRGMGPQWLLPIIFLTAVGAVLLSRKLK